MKNCCKPWKGKKDSQGREYAFCPVCSTPVKKTPFKVYNSAGEYMFTQKSISQQADEMATRFVAEAKTSRKNWDK